MKKILGELTVISPKKLIKSVTMLQVYPGGLIRFDVKGDIYYYICYFRRDKKKIGFKSWKKS